MKYNVGYQLMTDDRFAEYIVSQKDKVGEVYFSWGDFPNGRNAAFRNQDMLPWEAQAQTLKHLKMFAENGIPLNLLLNGNCYGKHSQSRAFFEKIGETIDYFVENCNLTSVTTTSPLIAKFIKNNFENIDVRASVNMEIGTIQGMKYLEEYFDSFYMKRELNRDFEAIKTLHAWCEEHGKGLYLLANSGCLNHCSAHNFHDNLVAHETEIAGMDNAYNFTGMCKEYLKDETNYETLADNMNFIRPEDMHLYEPYFKGAKLATRIHKNPIHVINSYIRGRYSGNLLELLEPAHSIYPYVLENGNPIKLVKLDLDIKIYEEEETSC